MNKELNLSPTREEQQEYQYYAFISYSHKDMKWARWLQKKLETYKLPSKLQENDTKRKDKKNSPYLIQPVFRDETSINPGKTVDDALKSELEKSKYLIVICSPASSASSWVDREVERFVEMGREDRIMPFIVEGVPHSDDPEKECYVPSLRALAEKKGSSILGSDVQARGEREAFLCTVAFLLGIDLETLRSREAERKRKKILTISALCIMFAAICIFAGIKAWDYYIPKVKYYQDYIMKFGLPEGYGRLTKQQTESRFEHYEITWQYGRLQRIAHKNAYGVITDRADSEKWDVFAYMEFDYADDGSLISSTRYLANGKAVVTWKYSDHLRVVQFEYPELNEMVGSEDDSTSNTATVAMTLLSDTQSMKGDAYTGTGERSFIAGYKIQYTEEGLERERYYCSMPSFGYRTSDANGIFGIRYSYDQDGHVTLLQYLDENNEVMNTLEGIAQRAYTYDQEGQMIRVEYQNKDGNLVRNSEGWAIDIQEYQNGNIVAEECRDENGELVISDRGFARLEVITDQFGNDIEMCIFGENGEAVLDNYGWWKQTFSYDEFGHETERKGYGLDGTPIRNTLGYASYRFNYDAKGNQIEWVFYDEEDHIIMSTYGFAIWRGVYNPQNECIEERYYDEKNNPVICELGYASVKRVFDNHGHITQSSFFGINDDPILGPDGFASTKAVFDARGNETERTYYDTVGDAIECVHGYARKASVYNAQGKPTETSFFGKDGIPVLSTSGYSSVRFKYDDKGNITDVSYYGTDGKLMIVQDGYAGWIAKYDDYGNRVEVCYYDVNRDPVVCNYGYAIRQVTYDSYNRPTETILLDADRNPIDQGSNEISNVEGTSYVNYHVTLTNASISLPEDWVFADRSINDNNDFCVAWGMTPEEFIGSFLSYDHYAFALDPNSGAGLFFDFFETDLKDYSAIGPNGIKNIGADTISWLVESGDKIISSEVVDLNLPYFKVISKSNDSINYYYETANKGKYFMFWFTIDPNDWDSSYEQIYDGIVRMSLLNGVEKP